MLQELRQKSQKITNFRAKIVFAVFAIVSLSGGFFSLTAFAQQADSTNANTNASDPATTQDSAVNTDPEDIGKLNEEITQKKSKIDELTKDIEVYKQAITAKRTESLTLKNHIAILDDEIHAVELEIENLKLDIRAQEEKIAEHKDTLEELLRILYRNDQKSVLDIILQNNSSSEYYNY